MKSESVDVVSEEADNASIRTSVAMNPDVELEVDKIIFSSEIWSDMQYIILRHTRSFLALVKRHVEAFFKLY